MPISAKRPQRIRVWEEPNGSFAVDHTGTLGDYLDLPFAPGATYTVNLDMIDPQVAGQVHSYRAKKVKGVKRATLTVSVPLATHTTKPAAGSVVAQSALGRLLKIAMGGESLGTARASSGSPTATSVPVTLSTGLNVGSALAFPTGPGGRYEARVIKNNATNTITPKHAFSTAPGTGVTCYPSATYYMGGTLGDQTTYLQAIVEGINPKDRFVLLGGFCTGFTITNIGPASPPGAVPRIEFVWTFAKWIPVASAAGSGSLTGALGRATFLNNVQLPVKDSDFRYQVNATTTLGTLIKAPSIGFNFKGVNYALHESPDGVETIVQPIRVPPDDGVPVTFEFTEPLNTADDAWRDERDNELDLGFWHQMGSTAAGMALIEVPTGQVISAEDDTSQITMMKVMGEGGSDGDTVLSGLTGTDLDRALSEARIHLL